MARTRLVMCWLAALTMTLVACRLGPDGPTTNADGSHRPVAHQLHETITPPPTLADARLAPATGDAGREALLPLDQIVADLPRPDFLPPTPASEQPGEVTESGIASEPVLAAQRAYVEGQSAWRAGDSAEAKRRLEDALRLAPNSAEVLRLLGLVYTATGNRVRGAYFLEQAAELDPDDAETLLLLSRFALEQSRWKDAIVGLHRVLDVTTANGVPIDPAIEPLSRYYLALALSNAGHAAAAADQYDRFLRADRRSLQASQWGRELLFLDRQQGQTFQGIGDLLHRLDQPADARKAYDRAQQAGVMNISELIQRQVYTDLRLGAADRAVERVVSRIRAAEEDQAGLELATYLIDQGVDGDALAQRLRDIYLRENRPAGLALAIARMVPPEQSEALLLEHLDQKPGDGAVFEALLTSKLPKGGVGDAHGATQYSDAVRVTAAVAAAAPTRASEYINLLLDRVTDYEALLDATTPGITPGSPPPTPTAESATPKVSGVPEPDAMRLVIRGATLMRLNRGEEAVDELTRAIDTDSTLAVARIELAKLLLATGKYETAGRLLQPLADRRDAEVVALRATVLSHTGHADEAMALLDEVIKPGPADPRLSILKARLQLRATDPTGAEQTLLDALNANPFAEEIYVALFEMYDANAVPDSIRQYQRLMRRMLGTIPTSRVARLMRANWLNAQSQYDEAQKLLLELLDENPDDLPVIRELVDVYVRANRRDRAIALVDKLVQDHPHDPRTLSQAQALFNDPIKDNVRALEVARRILMLMPEGSERTRQLALLLSAMGKNDEAIALLRDAIAKPDAPERGVMTALLWRALMQDQRDDEAVALLRQALDDPTLTDRGLMVELLWQSLYTNGKPDEALALLDAELGRDNIADPVPLVRAQLSILRDQNRNDEAEARIQDARQRFPDHAADLGYFWAMTLSADGKRDQAQRVLQDVLKDHPDHAPSNNDLAYVWSEENRNLDLALDMAGKAVAGEPENEAYLDTKGWVHYKLGDFDEAVRWLRRALAEAQRKLDQPQDQAPQQQMQIGGDRLDPVAIMQTQAVVGDHLGDALYRQGDTNGAQRVWLQAAARLTEQVPQDFGDLSGLKAKLNQKVVAVRHGQPPAVAPVPGVEDPPQPELLAEPEPVKGLEPVMDFDKP